MGLLSTCDLSIETCDLIINICCSKDQLYDIVEEIQNKGCKEATSTLEKALTTLFMDVQHLQDEYKTLENSFRKYMMHTLL